MHNIPAALAAFNTGAKEYNEIGFNDTPFRVGSSRGIYQTYKLALYIYTARLLNQTVPLSALVNMMRMQAPNGGFYTGYDVSFSHDSASTNTETTCLTIMALEAVSYNTGVRVYELTFRQVRYCGQFNIIPWAVTLNGLGLTEVEPSNQSLPLPTNTFSTIVPNQNLTRITFLVPSGTYSYTVSGGADFGGELYPGSGTVQVRESSVFVNVEVWLSFTCTASTTTP